MKRIWSMPSAVVLLAALGAAAAEVHTLAFEKAGLSLEWDKRARPASRTAGDDIVIEGTHRGIALAVVVRKGERIPKVQHQFRLMSYFPGEWRQTPDDCRGQGWEECSSWSWTAARTGDRGLGMAGHGPGGTYLVVLSCKAADFERLRPGMRRIQSSLRLF